MRCWGTGRNGSVQGESQGLAPSGVHCGYARFVLNQALWHRDVEGVQGHGGHGVSRVWHLLRLCGSVIRALG